MTRDPAAGAAPAREPATAAVTDAWASVPAQLRERGLRWTPQRRVLLQVLAGIHGHVTGAELVERCRAIDSSTIPSTVYRSLDVLEEIGMVRHCHGADGREEYHVLPAFEHGHLYCEACGAMVEVGEDDLRDVAALLWERRSFSIDPSHVTIVGRCAACGPASPGRPND